MYRIGTVSGWSRSLSICAGIESLKRKQLPLPNGGFGRQPTKTSQMFSWSSIASWKASSSVGLTDSLYFVETHHPLFFSFLCSPVIKKTLASFSFIKRIISSELGTGVIVLSLWIRRDGTGWDGTGWDGMGWDRTGWGYTVACVFFTFSTSRG